MGGGGAVASVGALWRRYRDMVRLTGSAVGAGVCCTETSRGGGGGGRETTSGPLEAAFRTERYRENLGGGGCCASGFSIAMVWDWIGLDWIGFNSESGRSTRHPLNIGRRAVDQ